MGFQISLDIKFRLKLTLLNFWIKLTQKGYFQTKKNENYHHFSSDWQFRFSGSNLPKTVFQVENRKSEHHHGILHIRISLLTKF